MKLYRQKPIRYIIPALLAGAVLISGCEDTRTGYAQGSEALSENMSEDASESLSESLLESEGYSESVFEFAGSPEELSETEEITEEAETEFLLIPAVSTVETEEEETDPEAVRFIPSVKRFIPGYCLPGAEDLPAPGHSILLLSCSLTNMMDTFDGNWSAAVRDLSTGEKLVVNDTAMPSASEMKLFIIECVYEDIRSGELERTAELVDWMTNMIRVSSNECANRILQRLGNGDYAAGIAHVNDHIRRAGYSGNTIAYNPFNDPSLVINPGHANQTSADDCAELLERIYRRQFGTRTACNEVEQMLLDQELRYKIPSVIPENCIVANKTGETDTIENDAALIYTPTGDYILTVFSNGWADKKTAQERIKVVSAEVYAYHTDPDYARRVFPFLVTAMP